MLRKCSEKNVCEVLDDLAKADQNLASLLQTASRKRRLNSEEGKVEEYLQNMLILDNSAKSRLESRFFAADEGTEKSAKRQRAGEQRLRSLVACNAL